MNRRICRRGFLKSTLLSLAGLLVAGSGIVCISARRGLAEPAASGEKKVLLAGASAVDISPQKLPVLSSGGFLERMGHAVRDPLHARGLVLDDGATRVAIVVVDNLMMPREMLDEVKQAAGRSTGIPTDRMLISATHTHAAPSVMGALGTGVDEPYAEFLPGRLVACIEEAVKNLAPARVGWAVVRDYEDNHCRVWIRRPDRIGTDPFGEQTVRAMMHPGYQNPDYIGPCGPYDPDLSVLAVQSSDGRPIAVLANYSMHYFGSAPVSADYFGRFAEKIKQIIGAEQADPPFVGIMSHGTSGDAHWMDYSRPRKSLDIDTYAQRVADAAYEAYRKIEYHDWVPIAMAEKKLTLGRRVPDEKRLAWARQMVAAMGERTQPKSRPEVYALEQIYLHEEPSRELKLQALRVGDLGITAIPNEVYGITGLKLKARSPLVPTMNIELANGGEGYIPPPELYPFGGYNTWPARSAGLEVEAEPKIVETLLGLLEEVSGEGRRKIAPADGPYSKAVLASQPIAYWQMRDFHGPQAPDNSGRDNHGEYEPGVAFYLEGPDSASFCGPGQTSRAAHFAGGRMKAALKGLGSAYSVEMWFCNGLPADARAVAGYLFSRGVDAAEDGPGDHLGIGGTHQEAFTGKLIFYNGDVLGETLVGKTEIPLKTWNHLVLVRDRKQVTVYLNGNPEPEISDEAAVALPGETGQVFLGGRNDNLYNFEGKISEAAVYDRILSPEEVAAHYKAAGP